jgi:hypothetical protein
MEPVFPVTRPASKMPDRDYDDFISGNRVQNSKWKPLQEPAPDSLLHFGRGFRMGQDSSHRLFDLTEEF